MKNKCLALIMVAALTTSCAAPPASADRAIERTDLGLLFSGELNDDSVLQLKSAIHPNDVVYVDSVGGDPSAALEAAYALRDARAHVVFIQCLNSCANYLYFSTARRTIETGNTLRFSPSVFLINRLIAQNPTSVTPDVRRKIDAHIKLYRALIDSSDVSPALLDCVDEMASSENNIVWTGPESDLFGLRPNIKSEFDQIAFERDALLTFGGSFDGNYFFPTDVDARKDYEEQFSVRIKWVSRLECGYRAGE